MRQRFQSLLKNFTSSNSVPASFMERLPYNMYDVGDALYLNEGSYGFFLEVTPLCGASEEMVNILSSMITDGVPEGTAIQVYNWASPKVAQKFNSWQEPRLEKQGVYKKLAEKRGEYFAKANWDSLFKNPYVIRNFRIFIAVSIPYSFGELGKCAILSLKEQLKTTLQSSGMHAWDINPDTFINILDEWVSPSVKDRNSILKWNEIDSLKEHICNFERSISVGENGLVFDKPSSESIEVRCFSINEYPEVWAQWFNQDLIGHVYSDFLRMPCPFLTVFSFVYGNENQENNRASMKSLRAMQQSGSGIAKFVPSILESNRDWKFVVEKIKNGQKLVRTTYQVLIFSKQDEVDSSERYIRSIYKAKGWNLQRDRYLQVQSFLTAMPFTLSEGMKEDLTKFARQKSMVTWSCANISPLQGEWKGHNSPLMLMFGRRGQPFYWNPFSNQTGNYNVAFIGKSGSGKSVAMQEMVSSLLGTGGQVVVIDDGRSFMNSCILQGGSFVEFSAEGSICLNPFSIVKEEVIDLNPDYKEEVLHFINLMIRQMCRETAPTDDIENARIAEAVNDVWKNYRNKGDVTKVSEYLRRHDDLRAKDLGSMLVKYTVEGLYARFFDGQASITLDNAFYVFEFDRIKSKPDLLKVVVMVVMFLAKEKAFHGDRSKTTTLVIDEAHSLLGGAQGADACEAFARKSRKHNAQLVTGTQSIDDYYKNAAGQAIVQNTDWFCLLSQNKESIESMKKSGRIAMDGEMEKALKSLCMVDQQYSEMMIYGGGIGWVIGRMILDPYSIALYSSKGEDFTKIQQLQKQGFSLEDAIENVAMKISAGKK